MLILSSPAKSLDFESDWKTEFFSTPDFLEEANMLVDILKAQSQEELQEILGVSEKLAALNVDRFSHWHPRTHDPMRGRPAILAYTGHVYQQIQAKNFSASQQKYAQESFRIITGLYGLLKPYDLILPYRLEMKVKLENESGANLYDYWRGLITTKLNEEAAQEGHKLIINLASNEYSKAIDRKNLNVKMLDITFKQRKGKDIKNIMLYSKQARGLMAKYLIESKADSYRDVVSFDVDGYKLVEETESSLLFIKKV